MIGQELPLRGVCSRAFLTSYSVYYPAIFGVWTLSLHGAHERCVSAQRQLGSNRTLGAGTRAPKNMVAAGVPYIQ